MPGDNSSLSVLIGVSRSLTHLVFAEMCENISNIAFSAYLFVLWAIYKYQLCTHVQNNLAEKVSFYVMHSVGM